MDDEIRKAIEVLTNLEASHTEKQDAAVGLANLANENDQNRVAIAAAGGIPALVALVTSSSKASKIQAASALGSLAFGNSQNKMAVAAAGGIPPLVAMVTNGSDSTKERAVAALVTLATDNAQNQVTIAAEGAIPPIVALVTNGSSSVKREAAHALTTLASDNAQNKVSIAAEGGIPPLVALVKHGSRIAKLEAAKALRNLSDENKQNCAAIAAAGGVPPLAALMTPASAASQTASAASQTATRALINMAVLDNQCCAAMASSAEVRAAIEGVAKDGTPENRDWAERLARELDSANDPVPKITGGLSVEKLKAEIQTLETGKEDQKAKGAEQLGNWAALSDENRVAITREGGAEALVGLVVTGSDDAKWHSARALRHLSNNDKAKKAIVKAGGIATLEVVVRHGKGQLKDAADEALKLLSQKDVESGSTPATKSADAKSVPAEAASAIPSGEGTRVAMFSARFDGGPVEKKFRKVFDILRDRKYDILMVAADAGDSFADLTTKYLGRLHSESGTMLAVCTKNYGEMTSSAYSAHEELKFALDYKRFVTVLPLRVEDTYPPEPPCGPEHAYDKDKLAQGYILSVFKPGIVFLDCRNKSELEIATEIAANLRRRMVTK